MDRQQRIDYYLTRLSQKGFEIYDVRRELEAQQVSESEIKAIVRAVDEELQKRLLERADKNEASAFIRYGIILAIIGGLLLAGSITKVFAVGKYILLGFGPLFVGLGMLVIGIFKRLRKKAIKGNADADYSGSSQKSSFRKNRK